MKIEYDECGHPELMNMTSLLVALAIATDVLLATHTQETLARRCRSPLDPLFFFHLDSSREVSPGFLLFRCSCVSHECLSE